jgi:hypothetical protein
VLTKELIPYAPWVLAAGNGNSSLNRAASSIDMLTKVERESVDAHVALLRTLGLTYVAAVDEPDFRRKDPMVQMTVNKKMVLEPPIDRLVAYTQMKFSSRLERIEVPAAVSMTKCMTSTIRCSKSHTVLFASPYR